MTSQPKEPQSKPNEGQKEPGKQGDTPEVVEAEIIDSTVEDPSTEQPGSTDRAAQSPKAAQVKKGSFLSKLGWSLVFLLSAFIGGLFAEPHLRPTLVQLGLERPGADQTAASEVDLAAFETRLTALETDLRRVSTDQGIVAEKLAQTSPGATAELSDILARLAAVEAAGASDGAAPAPGAIGAWSALETRQSAHTDTLAGLEKAVETLRSDLSRLATQDPRIPASVRQEMTALKSILDRHARALQDLEVGLREASDQALAQSPRGQLVLTLAGLRDKALAGQSLTADLAEARAHAAALSPASADRMGLVLDSLTRLSETNPPSFRSLTESFTTVASQALAARDAAEDKFLAGLFIARDTSAGATGLDALLNQAEARLAARDIAGASEILLQAEGAAAGALAPWRSEADRLVSVLAGLDEAIRTLSSERAS